MLTLGTDENSIQTGYLEADYHCEISFLIQITLEDSDYCQAFSTVLDHAAIRHITVRLHDMRKM